MIYYPATYDGPSYINTEPHFGWGKPSSYMYNIDSVAKVGTVYTKKYKKFGRMGYSTDPTGGVLEDVKTTKGTTVTGCTPTYMAITVIPKLGFTQSGEVFEIVVG